MNPELKEKWINLLRSGAIPIAYTRLVSWGCCGTRYKTPRYSALGVLAIISGKKFFADQEMLPEDIRIEAGLSEEDMKMIYNINSEGYYSFDDIASWIEKNL